jgi:hypothetical protein
MVFILLAFSHEPHISIYIYICLNTFIAHIQNTFPLSVCIVLDKEVINAFKHVWKLFPSRVVHLEAFRQRAYNGACS